MHTNWTQKLIRHNCRSSIFFKAKINLIIVMYVYVGSATSLEESRESTPSAGTITKKYESDIEVLSNPSQSSIEVLDDSSKLVSFRIDSFLKSS